VAQAEKKTEMHQLLHQSILRPHDIKVLQAGARLEDCLEHVVVCSMRMARLLAAVSFCRRSAQEIL
jgi:hypothetical protein